VSGLQWSDYRNREIEAVRQAQAEIYALHAAGKLAPQIMTRLPLEKFAEAFALVEAAQTTGRVLLAP
jgi:NADPH:quinone reductase-like Zn-dependent oxidoreductase